MLEWFAQTLRTYPEIAIFLKELDELKVFSFAFARIFEFINQCSALHLELFAHGLNFF